MTMTKTALYAAAAIAALTAAAGAQDSNSTRSTQNNWAKARAELNADIESVSGDVALTAAAIGNSLSVELAGPSYVENLQTNRASISTEAWAELEDVAGDVSVTAAAIGNSATVEIDAENSLDGMSVFNNQNSNGHISSHLALEIDNTGYGSDVAEAVTATSAAIGNSFSATLAGGEGYSNNRQIFNGDAFAEMYADIQKVDGDVALTTAAIGNSASYDLTEAYHVSIDNYQGTAIDPTAVSAVEAENIWGGLASTTAALGNSFSVSTLPDTSTLSLNSTQINNAATNADAWLDVQNVSGDVTATAAAIGNSLSISGLAN